MTEKQKTRWSTGTIIGAILGGAVLVLGALVVRNKSKISCWLKRENGTKLETHQPAERRATPLHHATQNRRAK